MTQNPTLFTVVETPTFTRLWPDTGKRGGVRVIHYNRLADGTIYLLLIYSKGVRDDIDAATLNSIRRTLDGEDD